MIHATEHFRKTTKSPDIPFRGRALHIFLIGCESNPTPSRFPTKIGDKRTTIFGSWAPISDPENQHPANAENHAHGSALPTSSPDSFTNHPTLNNGNVDNKKLRVRSGTSQRVFLLYPSRNETILRCNWLSLARFRSSTSHFHPR